MVPAGAYRVEDTAATDRSRPRFGRRVCKHKRSSRNVRPAQPRRSRRATAQQLLLHAPAGASERALLRQGSVLLVNASSVGDAQPEQLLPS